MFKKLIFVLILLSPLVYYFYTTSRDAAIAEMIGASENNDVAAMAQRFDWDTLRAQMKEDITAQKKAAASYGDLMGPTLGRVDEVVDYYVQPENIELAYYYHEQLFPEAPEDAFIYEITYQPPFGFGVLLGYPQHSSVPGAENPILRERIKARFIFGLDGFTWKVQDIDTPLFMVPKKTYDRPALERFGPRRP